MPARVLGTATRHRNRLGQLGELEQESNTDSEQKSTTAAYRCVLTTETQHLQLLGQVSTVAPVMFGKPLLNNVLRLDHAQLQKRSDCWDLWVICQ